MLAGGDRNEADDLDPRSWAGADADRVRGRPARARRGPGHSDAHAAQGGSGKVVGTFIRVGGPLGAGGKQPPSIPLSGTLSFSAGHRRAVAVQVGKSGRFSVWLPAGTYDVSGRSPSIIEMLASGATLESQCSQQVPFAVVAARTVHIAVVCAVP
jgi:hypothetical protein